MTDSLYGPSFRRALASGDVYRIARNEERAKKSPVRVAILGAGGVAQAKYLPALTRLQTLSEPVSVVAASVRSPAKVNLVEGRFGVPTYTDTTLLLRETAPDAVIIAASDSAHRELAEQALASGAHILVEKPLSRSLKDAQEMCDLARETGLALLTVCNKRFSPPYARAKGIIDEGLLLNPALLTAKFTLGYDYVDILESGTVHIFDIVRFLLGPVSRLRAIAAADSGGQPHDSRLRNVLVSLEFASGAIGTVASSATALSQHPWERVEIFGDSSWIQVEDQRQITLYDDDYGPAKSWGLVVPNTLYSAEGWGGFVGLLDAFLDVVRGESHPWLDQQDGFRAVELVVASHLSLLRGSAIELPLDVDEAEAELADARADGERHS